MRIVYSTEDCRVIQYLKNNEDLFIATLVKEGIKVKYSYASDLAYGIDHPYIIAETAERKFKIHIDDWLVIFPNSTIAVYNNESFSNCFCERHGKDRWYD